MHGQLAKGQPDPLAFTQTLEAGDTRLRAGGSSGELAVAWPLLFFWEQGLAGLGFRDSSAFLPTVPQPPV